MVTEVTRFILVINYIYIISYIIHLYIYKCRITPETNTMLYVSYTYIKIKRKKLYINHRQNILALFYCFQTICEYNHAILWCFASFIQPCVYKIHVCCCEYI